jgi:hypothetical protein
LFSPLMPLRVVKDFVPKRATTKQWTLAPADRKIDLMLLIDLVASTTGLPMENPG